jgi:hypothetical protein
MSAVRAWGEVAFVAGVAVAVWTGAVRDRAQRARLDGLARELADARSEVATLRASDSVVKSPAAVFLAQPTLEPRAADAIAQRVLAAAEARASAERALQEDAKAPTASQLAARDLAKRTLDGAILRGRLRREDVLSVRETLAADPAGRAELGRQIAVALNMNKLVPEDRHAIFP